MTISEIELLRAQLAAANDKAAFFERELQCETEELVQAEHHSMLARKARDAVLLEVATKLWAAVASDIPPPELWNGGVGEAEGRTVCEWLRGLATEVSPPASYEESFKEWAHRLHHYPHICGKHPSTACPVECISKVLVAVGAPPSSSQILRLHYDSQEGFLRIGSILNCADSRQEARTFFEEFVKHGIAVEWTEE